MIFSNKKKCDSRYILVKFENGKYGVRRLFQGRFEMLDMNDGHSWWGIPEHWTRYAQADAKTAVEMLERLNRSGVGVAVDVGTPL